MGSLAEELMNELNCETAFTRDRFKFCVNQKN